MSLSDKVPERSRFSDLPLDKEGPRGNALGLFGKNDEVGLLNYITPEVTIDALKEVRHGVRVCTDLPLDFFKFPSFGRATFYHEVKQVNDWAVTDDTLTFNPQSATQWDGFRHFGYQDRKQYYQGITQEQFQTSTSLGVNGGIATREVLLDFARWAEDQQLNRPALESTPISAQDLRDVAAWEGIALRKGDVLMVRSGFIRSYAHLSNEMMQRRNEVQFAASIGLEQSRDMLEFLWASGNVAVVGDMLTLEVWPWQDEDFWLREWLLAGWGCPIGEYFDLEKLASGCHRLQQWPFFFSSTPLNVNGMAIL